jgi:hypothetical protein
MNSMGMELEEKIAAKPPDVVGVNLYSAPVITRPATEPKNVPVAWTRRRIPSYNMRELARGKFLVNSEDITLLDCIGEGVAVLLKHT